MSEFSLPMAPADGKYGVYPMEVVGEYYRPEGQALLRSAALPGATELSTRFCLVPEPDNPYDNRAISVRFQGQVVGYLSRGAASRWWPAITYLVANGRTPRVHGHVVFARGGVEVRLSMAKPRTSVRGVSGVVPYKDQGCPVPSAFMGSGQPAASPVKKSVASRVSRPSRSSSNESFEWGCAMTALAVFLVIFLIIYALM